MANAPNEVKMGTKKTVLSCIKFFFVINLFVASISDYKCLTQVTGLETIKELIRIIRLQHASAGYRFVAEGAIINKL